MTLASCSGRVSVEGIVTLDGKPLPSIGSVTFMPEQPGVRPAQGAIINGEFVLSTSDKSGVMPGKYKVVISCAPGGKEMLPPTYSSSRTSILTYDVTASNQQVHFNLNSEGTKPAELPSPAS